MNLLQEIIDGLFIEERRRMENSCWEDVTIFSIKELSKKPLCRVARMVCPFCNESTMNVSLYGTPTHLMHYCPKCGHKMVDIVEKDGERR